jgi:hypothetical protein
MRAALLISMLAVTGCAPKLYVNVLRPAAVNLGPVKKLTVVQTDGRLDARARIVRELIAQANTSGYFTVVEQAGAAPGPDDIALSLTVLEYTATPDPSSEKHSMFIGKVVVAVTATDAKGHAFVTAKPYKGNVSSDSGEDDALAASSRMAVTTMLEDFTPAFARQAIELDEEDLTQQPVVELARRGDVKGAIAREREMIKTPTAAGAFNLGALLDSQGEYAEALGFYDQAIKLQMKELYVDTRGACARRLADTQALGR